MINYTLNFFRDSKNEVEALKKVWFPITIYQTIIRIFLIIIFWIVYWFLVKWILINPGEEKVFLTWIDTISQIHLWRFIIAIIFCINIFFAQILIEYLWVVSIARQYYLWKKVTLKKTIFEVLKYFKTNFKVQLLKYLFISFNIVFAILCCYWISQILPNTVWLLLSLFIIITSLYITVDKIITYNYVGQKVFEGKKNIFEVYNYNISKERKIELLKYYSFKIFLLGFILIIMPILWLRITYYISLIPEQYIDFSHLLFSLNTLILIISWTVYSYLFVSFFTLRSTRMYLDYTWELSENRENYKDSTIKKYKKTFIWITTVLASFATIILYLWNYMYYDEVILNQKKITIFAHRASMMNSTNNSIEALDYCVKNNIEYVEIDIQLSKEWIPVVFHDYTYYDWLQKKYINNTPLSELKKFDLRTNKNSEINKEEIPTLEEFLIHSKWKIKVNIEIKTTKNFEEKLAIEVWKVINKLDMKDEVIVTSFENKILQKIKEVVPWIQTGLIITAYVWEVEEIWDIDVDWLMVNNIYYDLNKTLFREFGKKIALWSFEEQDWDYVIYDTIDWVIIDDPVNLKNKIKEYNMLSKTEQFYKHIEYWFFNETNSTLLR